MDRERDQNRAGSEGRRRSSGWYVVAAMSLATLVVGCGSSGGNDKATGEPDPGSEVADASDSPETDPGEDAEDDPVGSVDDLPEAVPGVVAGGGTATITISGTEYAFDSDYCIGTGTSFEILGSGETDGESFYAEITLDDAAADLDDDGQEDRTGDVSLTVGDDGSIYKSIVQVTGMGEVEEFTYDIGDGAATGNGRIVDAMAGGVNDFEFAAECT